MSIESRAGHPPMVYVAPPCRDGQHAPHCVSGICTCECHRKRREELAQSQFIAVRRVVMQADKRICEAVSSTLARRIANALNRYTPNRKGY